MDADKILRLQRIQFWKIWVALTIKKLTPKFEQDKSHCSDANRSDFIFRISFLCLVWCL